LQKAVQKDLVERPKNPNTQRPKEHPILFTGEMGRAILEGHKTQTRRVMKPQPKMNSKYATWQLWGDQLSLASLRDENLESQEEWTVPYGQAGDRLWVRETFLRMNGKEGSYAYRADGWDDARNKWRPSIFMPRWASRLTLEIVRIRVERVQSLAPSDALAEGVRIPVNQKNREHLIRVSGKFLPLDYLKVKPDRVTPDQWLIAYYASLWDSINSERGFPWKNNPWVWVVEFKPIANRRQPIAKPSQ